MSSNPWPAPAKLNLFLHILGRRDDGYHNLQTVFQFLEFGDQLNFVPTDDGEIRLEAYDKQISQEDDLIYRAARQLKEVTGTDHGVAISVIKRIPIGGGLGGGSSDAATTLLALNQLWGTGLGLDELARLGLGIGADVPVFVHGYSAWAEGAGENLTPIELPEPWFLVIHPGCHVGTVSIFNIADLTRNTAPITIRDFLDGAGHNDCKAVVFRQYPEIASAAAWLEQWTEAKLSGTGSCIFGQFGCRDAAQAVLSKLPEIWQGFVSQGINISPLRRKLDCPAACTE